MFVECKITNMKSARYTYVNATHFWLGGGLELVVTGCYLAPNSLEKKVNARVTYRPDRDTAGVIVAPHTANVFRQNSDPACFIFLQQLSFSLYPPPSSNHDPSRNR